MADQESLQFHVFGEMNGSAVTAVWSEGQLRADDALLRAAHKLVEAAVVFESADGRRVAADLDDPLGALLTIIRSMTRVTSARVRLAAQVGWGEIFDGDGHVVPMRGHDPDRGPSGSLSGYTAGAD